MGNLVGVGLHFLKGAHFLKSCNNDLACVKAVEAMQAKRCLQLIGMGNSFNKISSKQVKLGKLVEDIDLRQAVPPADLEVVEIMGRRNLHRTCSLFGIGIIIAHDGYEAANKRQAHVAADEMFQLLILGMNGYRRIAQHSFGPRRGNDDLFAGSTVSHRIPDIPQPTLNFLLYNFKIGNRCQQLGVPIHQALVLVDQLFLIELHEHLAHGGRQALIHGKALPRPVAGCTQAPQLLGDNAAGFLFPLPYALQEGFTAHGTAVRPVLL